MAAATGPTSWTRSCSTAHGSLSGRTRVIVQFKDDSDVRVLGKRAAAGRRLGRNSQVAEVDNVELANIAAIRASRASDLDRPIFATLERTGLIDGSRARTPAAGRDR